MKNIILFTTLLLLSFGSAGEVLTFGKAINTEVTIKISTILATPKNYLNNDVTIEGTIIGVCSRRGCWMELASDAKFEKIRIKPGTVLIKTVLSGDPLYYESLINVCFIKIRTTHKM